MPFFQPGLLAAVESASMTYSLSSLSMYKPARPPELFPFGDELAVSVENLQARVAAIADEHAAARVDRERMRISELAGARPELAPFLDELAVFREFQDARDVVGRHLRVLPRVPVGDEDVAVGAVTTSDGSLKCVAPPPAMPAMPSLIRTLPSGDSLMT